MSFWRGRTVLVTGGASFIGSHLVDELVCRGANVRLADDLSSGRPENLARSRERIDFREGDRRAGGPAPYGALRVVIPALAERAFRLMAAAPVPDCLVEFGAPAGLRSGAAPDADAETSSGRAARQSKRQTEATAAAVVGSAPRPGGTSWRSAP